MGAKYSKDLQVIPSLTHLHGELVDDASHPDALRHPLDASHVPENGYLPRDPLQGERGRESGRERGHERGCEWGCVRGGERGCVKGRERGGEGGCVRGRERGGERGCVRGRERMIE